MVKDPALILIDEFGNTHLDLSKSGTFSHFIYCSLIIPTSKKSEAARVRDLISKNFFYNTEVKSSKLGTKMFDRRLAALKTLITELDFTVDILVIDKIKLENTTGLKFKKIFYKYFQALFVHKYNKRYKSFEIIADQVGELFKYELQDYVRTNGIQVDLFNPDRAFHLKEDYKEEPLLQLADFVCGAAGKVFCASHSDPRALELFELLHSRMSVSYFPHKDQTRRLAAPSKTVDEQISKVTLSIIQDFQEKNVRANSDALLLLEYLILHNNINNNRLISTYEIINYLHQFLPDITEEKLRLMVRNLRYEGLFIVSHSGKSGYKIAANYYDIEEYFKHFSRYVVPMLQKIKIFNEALSANTFNEINPLEKDESFSQLKNLMKAL